MATADLPKVGWAYDLPIALGVLTAAVVAADADAGDFGKRDLDHERPGAYRRQEWLMTVPVMVWRFMTAS